MIKMDVAPEGPLARWGMVTSVNLLAVNVFLLYRWLGFTQRTVTVRDPPLASAAMWYGSCCASARLDLMLGLCAVICGVFPM
eukprot:SAG31_NODE_23623_length_500_cov_0.902743_2_plen_81_part_01